jgi:hypothetical protein
MISSHRPSTNSALFRAINPKATTLLPYIVQKVKFLTKCSYSSITQNPTLSAPDTAHNSQVHTAAIICVHALLKIGPNRTHITPTQLRANPD